MQHQHVPGMGIGTADLRGNGCGYEELGTVGVLSRVGHAEHAGLAVLQFEVLIRKLVPIDGFPTSACYASQTTIRCAGCCTLSIPSPLVKSPPWIMNCLMTLWKVDPS